MYMALVPQANAGFQETNYQGLMLPKYLELHPT